MKSTTAPRSRKRDQRVGNKFKFMTAKEIVANREDISLVTTAAASQGKFCELWPQAKQGLVLLQSIIKNPIAKAAIGIVIGAGDAVAKSVCG